MNAAAHGVFAPLFTGQFFQSDQGAAYLAAVGAGIGQQMAAGLGAGLTLAQMGFGTTVQGAFNATVNATGDVTAAVNAAAQAAAGVGAQDLMTLAATAMPSSLLMLYLI